MNNKNLSVTINYVKLAVQYAELIKRYIDDLQYFTPLKI